MAELDSAFDFLKCNPSFPSTAFLGLGEDQRKQVLDHIYKTPMNVPQSCAISGFKIGENGMEPVFGRYTVHVKELLHSYSADQNPSRPPRASTRRVKEAAANRAAFVK